MTDRLRSYGAAHRPPPEDGPMVKPSRGNFTPSVSTTRAGNTSLKAYAEFTEFRIRSCLSSQSHQFGTQSLLKVKF